MRIPDLAQCTMNQIRAVDRQVKASGPRVNLLLLTGQEMTCRVGDFGLSVSLAVLLIYIYLYISLFYSHALTLNSNFFPYEALYPPTPPTSVHACMFMF